jgi:hypothetical protein
VRLAFLSKLYFLVQEENDSARELIDRQLEICRGWRDNHQQQGQTVGSGEYIRGQIFAFRTGQIQAMIDWLENSRDSLPGK